MKISFAGLLYLVLISCNVLTAQGFNPDSANVFFEYCLEDKSKSPSNDDEFYCECITERILKFFTKEEFDAFNSSSPKVTLLRSCFQMANEFGDKPVRSEELEWDFIMTGVNTEVKLTRDGVYYTVNNPGTGTKPLPGQTVVIECELGLPSADEYIYSTIKDGTPLTFEVGKNTMIKGLELGVQLFGLGGEGFIYFPPELGYGSSDRGEQLPANSVLLCHIKILEIK